MSRKSTSAECGARKQGATLLAFGLVLVLAGCGEAAVAPSSSGPPTAPAGAPPAGTGNVVSLASVRKVFNEPRLSQGKPLTFFLGGQFCPFCAAMRWPLVKALQRFGTFSSFGEMKSRAGEDGFASLSTYDLSNATYKSDYLTLHVVESADANGNPLQQPTAEDAPLVNQFDPRGSIPFVFFAGKYVFNLPYSPQLLEGRTYQQILDEVNSATPGPLGQAVNESADTLTALTCKNDGGQPASVCGMQAMQALIQKAP